MQFDYGTHKVSEQLQICEYWSNIIGIYRPSACNSVTIFQSKPEKMVSNEATLQILHSSMF